MLRAFRRLPSSAHSRQSSVFGVRSQCCACGWSDTAKALLIASSLSTITSQRKALRKFTEGYDLQPDATQCRPSRWAWVRRPSAAGITAAAGLARSRGLTAARAPGDSIGRGAVRLRARPADLGLSGPVWRHRAVVVADIGAPHLSGTTARVGPAGLQRWPERRIRLVI